jgi:hypothetical protein
MLSPFRLTHDRTAGPTNWRPVSHVATRLAPKSGRYRPSSLTMASTAKPARHRGTDAAMSIDPSTNVWNMARRCSSGCWLTRAARPDSSRYRYWFTGFPFLEWTRANYHRCRRPTTWDQGRMSAPPLGSPGPPLNTGASEGRPPRTSTHQPHPDPTGPDPTEPDRTRPDVHRRLPRCANTGRGGVPRPVPSHTALTNLRGPAGAFTASPLARTRTIRPSCGSNRRRSCRSPSTT